jgi:hypothetical protein
MIAIRGTLATADLRRAEYFLSYRRGWSWTLSLVSLLLLFTFAAFGYVQERDSGQRLAYIPLAVFFVLWISCAIALPLHAARSRLASQQWLIEPLTFTFGADGIQIASDSVFSEFTWSAIKEICETRSLFLLYRTERSAFTIPKRLFANAAEIEAWKGLVQTQTNCRRIVIRGLAARLC